ncbi:MAG: response regulator [Raineya sp.]|jgi:DNA-binding NarL/FixJ family response regulator|nr:response regulator [Raineya sp.]
MKILLVDDEIILQNLFKFHLKNLGFEDVMVAQTGEQAIALAEEHQPQIAFLDINLLTNVDGIEAGKEIKKKSPNTYIIFVSANEDSVVMERASQVENLGFLNKPYNPELIEQYIKMVAMRIRKANRNK